MEESYMNILPNGGPIKKVWAASYSLGQPHVFISDEHGNCVVLSKDVIELALQKLRELEGARA